MLRFEGIHVSERLTEGALLEKWSPMASVIFVCRLWPRILTYELIYGRCHIWGIMCLPFRNTWHHFLVDLPEVHISFLHDFDFAYVCRYFVHCLWWAVLFCVYHIQWPCNMTFHLRFLDYGWVWLLLLCLKDKAKTSEETFTQFKPRSRLSVQWLHFAAKAPVQATKNYFQVNRPNS